MVKKQTFLCNLLKSVGTEFGFKCGDFLVRFRNAFQNYINPLRTGGDASQNCRCLLYSNVHDEVGAALSCESRDQHTNQ